MKDKMKQVKKIGMTDRKTLMTRPIEVGDWVRYNWGHGNFTIAVVGEILDDLSRPCPLYHLSNGARLRHDAFVDVRKKA